MKEGICKRKEDERGPVRALHSHIVIGKLFGRGAGIT